MNDAELSEEIKRIEEQAAFKALSPCLNSDKKSMSRMGKVKAHKFFSVKDVLETVTFEQPTACFLQVVNMDKIDSDGFPEVNTIKIKDSKISWDGTNTFSHGKLVGSTVNYVYFSYRLVLAFISRGEYKLVIQNIKSTTSPGNY
ncbi:MAG: hypothetical protein WC325_08415 [Candidatus Bathyarchaeia archaeon]|jgi:hypothetical protein